MLFEPWQVWDGGVWQKNSQCLWTAWVFVAAGQEFRVLLGPLISFGFGTADAGHIGKD
jgi:hypothetical protein